MRLARRNTAACGHPCPNHVVVVHNGQWLCPHCAARIFFDCNAGLICETAASEYAAGREAEAEALCEMALACGPCPQRGGCRLATHLNESARLAGRAESEETL